MRSHSSILLLAAIAPALLAVATANAGTGGPPTDRQTARAVEPDDPRGFFTGRRIDVARSGIAIAGLGLLVWGAALRRIGRPAAAKRLRDGLLLLLGIAGGLGWWNFLRFHNPGYLHESDAFHYFVGAKYFSELGYTRLYDCTALADREAGLGAELLDTRIRNLATNRVETAELALARGEICRSRFSAPRWREFQRDVGWFRAHHAPAHWRRVKLDHGFNATPAWAIAGVHLTNWPSPTGPLVHRLSWVDPALLVVMWACVGWAFGWRTGCVALIYWGTIQTAPFGWTGGSILRQDWLAASVIGLCLLRKRFPTAGGFLLAWAALLRVFPVLILAGIGLQALGSMRARRQLALAPEHRRIALGCALALAIALPASAWVGSGLSSWGDFAANSRVHLATPLRNHLGLKTLLSYDHATRSAVSRDSSQPDPYAAWKQGRRAAFERRQPVYWLLVLGFTVLLARATARSEDWVAGVLGLGLIPIALELTGYYYAVLLGYAFLWRRREIVGIALLGFAALSWASVEYWHSYDESYTWTSLFAVATVTAVTALMARRDRGERGKNVAQRIT